MPGVERTVELAARQTTAADGILILLDADFSGAQYRAKGVYLSVRTRFDWTGFIVLSVSFACLLTAMPALRNQACDQDRDPQAKSEHQVGNALLSHTFSGADGLPAERRQGGQTDARARRQPRKILPGPIPAVVGGGQEDRGPQNDEAGRREQGHARTSGPLESASEFDRVADQRDQADGRHQGAQHGGDAG